MITIVDYGLGNISAFANVYRRLDRPVLVAQNADQLDDADRIVLPGVGSFDHAMERLEESGMRSKLDEMVLGRKVPVLGVCVGMQMMGISSEEGELGGLGWIDGVVRRLGFGLQRNDMVLPHMGWNDVLAERGSGLFDGLDQEARFYFLHTFAFYCNNDSDIAARADYGEDFVCAISHGNIHGVQFHPEKSHHFGVRLLENFARV